MKSCQEAGIALLHSRDGRKKEKKKRVAQSAIGKGNNWKRYGSEEMP
jgi:hypothetical protein